MADYVIIFFISITSADYIFFYFNFCYFSRLYFCFVSITLAANRIICLISITSADYIHFFYFCNFSRLHIFFYFFNLGRLYNSLYQRVYIVFDYVSNKQSYFPQTCRRRIPLVGMLRNVPLEAQLHNLCEVDDQILVQYTIFLHENK